MHYTLPPHPRPRPRNQRKAPSPTNGEGGDKSDSTWTINKSYYVDYELLVTIWDMDVSFVPDLATCLQSHDFVLGEHSSPITLKNPNDAEYKIYFTLTDA